jgi:enterochelin esterase-like enzyme
VSHLANPIIDACSRLDGLQALFTAFEHPETFGNTITLSGSYWWKPKDSSDGEWLTRQIQSVPKRPIRVYQEVGLMEAQGVQIDTNHRMREALSAKGHASE